MLHNSTIITHFQNQAKVCGKMGSPFTEKLIHNLINILDDTSQTGTRIDNWNGDPVADALALRLCGALHSIVISNPSDPLAAIYPNGDHVNYSDILNRAIHSHDGLLNKWLDLPPQTNETGRAAALLPGFLHISRQCNWPLHLCEIGSSAGLNLQMDQFHYAYNETNWGNLNSPVKLNPKMRGEIPNLAGELNIASRIGCDISPLNILDESQQLRLRSYVWPDQQYRSDRLNGAIKLAIETPPELLQMDAADFVENQLAQRPQNTALVLMHSVVWQYLPQVTQQRIEAALNEHGANASNSNPIYWLRLEGMGGKESAAAMTLDAWPYHSQTVLAHSCFHGSWIKFI